MFMGVFKLWWDIFGDGDLRVVVRQFEKTIIYGKL